MTDIIDGIKKSKIMISFGGYDVSRVITECFITQEKWTNVSSDDVEYVIEEWKSSIDNDYKCGRLNSDDKELLYKFSDSLGLTDTDGQLSNCDMYIELFSERLSKAREYEEKNGKLYRVLGLSIGCAVTLIML